MNVDVCMNIVYYFRLSNLYSCMFFWYYESVFHSNKLILLSHLFIFKKYVSLSVF